MQKRRILKTVFSLVLAFSLTIAVPMGAYAETDPGWQYSDGNWYYYNEDGSLRTDNWTQDSAGWCYLDSDGRLVTDCWMQDSTGWCYLGSDGHLVTNQWMQDSTGWCYLDWEGHVLTNQWMQDSTGWCYLGSDGHLVTDCWMQDSTGWCYLGSDGHLVTDCWMQDSTGWCYLDWEGHVLTNGWMQDSTGWCYLDGNGHLLTDSWMQDSTDWCYLGSDGHVVTDCWMTDTHGWCYLGSDGYILKNGWIADSTGWCYMDWQGHLTQDHWLKYQNNWYFMDEAGHMMLGWHTIDGNLYYFYENGVMAKDTWIGEDYVDGSGIWQPDGPAWYSSSQALAEAIMQNGRYDSEDGDYSWVMPYRLNALTFHSVLTYRPDEQIISFATMQQSEKLDMILTFDYDMQTGNCVDNTLTYLIAGTEIVCVMTSDLDISTFMSPTDLYFQFDYSLIGYSSDARELAEISAHYSFPAWQQHCQEAGISLQDLGFTYYQG